MPIAQAADYLLSELGSRGYWEGRLSGSALATALAAFALDRADRSAHQARVASALGWLSATINPDGGWGDSPDSPSNRTATLVCRTVVRALPPHHPVSLNRTDAWLVKAFGSLSAESIRDGILADYGRDKTFSVPILTLLALAGQIPWVSVPQLPFELGVCPHFLFRWVHLPVVSYALPALIAMGIVRHRKVGKIGLLVKGLRGLFRRPALMRLAVLQPDNGGFIEAPPLTSFVLMSLVGAGEGKSRAALKCGDFLRSSQRSDGSWPIDTHLATWLTSLSVDALTVGRQGIPIAERGRIENYLLAAQHRRRHPYTGAAPGGWAWTHLPGGVPDADDTAGALIALRHLHKEPSDAAAAAVQGGLRWLMRLQNRDGGIPTFCRGRGRLPFDRSCPDITAHALRAFAEWREILPERRDRLGAAIANCIAFLRQSQDEEGAWRPLWFGNQKTSGQYNPVYGTSQVVTSLCAVRPMLDSAVVEGMIERGADFLLGAQNNDGGWGGDLGAPSSIEETAMALRALAGCGHEKPAEWAARWLETRTAHGTRFPCAPIGLYFARLWYSEKLYPVIQTVAAGGSLSICEAESDG